MKLKPMDGSRYEAWMQYSIREYANANIESGRWDAADAVDKAKCAHLEQLPDGLDTTDHYVFELFNDEKYLGYLWVFVDTSAAVPSAFIYDIEIITGERGKGLGKLAMLALENWCKNRGIQRLGLNVFAFNEQAIKLYQGLGFRATNYQMQKDL